MRSVLSLFVLLVLWAMPAQAEFRFHFEDEFSDAEKTMLVAWIHEVKKGVESLVGPYPFDVQIRFVKSARAGPVPWANTLRGRRQGVRFHVDPRYALDDFRADWTAPHELSHLILPFLGKEHSWFAEGFASYMQYQVMRSMGVIDSEELRQRYRQKLEKASSDYRYSDMSIVDAAPRLRAERKYPVMYWGGAAFFLQLDDMLGERGDERLIELLSSYMNCCRTPRDSLDGLVDALDELVGEPLVARHLAVFAARHGFPEFVPE